MNKEEKILRVREEKILKMISKQHCGMCIKEIAEKIKLSTITTARILDKLIAEKRLHRKEIGRIKLHFC